MMSGVATTILDPTRHWVCPSCPATHVTKLAGVHTPMHDCPGQAGLSVPYVEHTDRLNPVRVRHLPVEREDWVGTEHGVTHDVDGRAISAVRTERWDDTNDTVVFAPTAVGASHPDERQP